jgi:hypothetical protein
MCQFAKEANLETAAESLARAIAVTLHLPLVRKLSLASPTLR